MSRLDLLDGLRKARIGITNYHAFMLRGNLYRSRSSTAKFLVAVTVPRSFHRNRRRNGCARSQDANLMGRKNIIVLNDEAHHCYRHKVGGDAETLSRLTAKQSKEAEKNEEAARVWISGIEAFNRKIGVQLGL